MDHLPVVPKAAWLTRFGRRLMELQPRMTAVTAATLSIGAHRDGHDAMPERTAERLVQGHADTSGAGVGAPVND